MCGPPGCNRYVFWGVFPFFPPNFFLESVRCNLCPPKTYDRLETKKLRAFGQNVATSYASQNPGVSTEYFGEEGLESSQKEAQKQLHLHIYHNLLRKEFMGRLYIYLDDWLNGPVNIPLMTLNPMGWWRISRWWFQPIWNILVKLNHLHRWG